MIALVMATRTPKAYDDDLARWIRLGASPRATIALERCARAHAWLSQKDYVSPSDIRFVVHDVLRHRILLNYEAQAENMSTDDIIDRILSLVAIP